MITITCVSENTVRKHSLLASHGQALHINYFGKQYLFDTGEIYEGFVYNTQQLNLHIANIDTIILSHNHLDHSGALFQLINTLQTQRLWLPPDMKSMDESKYSQRYRGNISKEDAIQSLLVYPNAQVITSALQVEENFFTTGPLPAGEITEQSLVINIPGKGLVVMVACSHSTLPAIIKKAKEITHEEKVYGLIGGFHFITLSDEELKSQIEFLESIGMEFLIPSHCTGYRAIRRMQEKFGDKIKVSGTTGQFGVGNSVTLLPEPSFDIV